MNHVLNQTKTETKRLVNQVVIQVKNPGMNRLVNQDRICKPSDETRRLVTQAENQTVDQVVNQDWLGKPSDDSKDKFLSTMA